MPAVNGLELKTLGAMYQSMTAMPKLIRLECETCGRRKPITKNIAASNLQNGWPECCGYTMLLVTENDIKEGRSKPWATEQAASCRVRG